MNILSITAPLYLLIGLGFVSVHWGWLTLEHIRGLAKVLVTLILPVLVFRAIAQYDLPDVFQADYLLVYGLGSLLVLAVGWGWSLFVSKQSWAQTAFTGLGFAASNSVFVGYPIAWLVIGETANMALALCLLIENLLIFPLTLMLAEVRDGESLIRALWQAIAGQRKNPVVLGILAGAIWGTTGWQMPQVINQSTSWMAAAAAPMALLMIGGVLRGDLIRLTPLRDLVAMTMGKLLLHPLLMLGVLIWIPIADPQMRLAAVLFAAMPMPSVAPALGLKYKLDGYCAAGLVVSMLASFVTINAWLWWLDI